MAYLLTIERIMESSFYYRHQRKAHIIGNG
jgi:hypothetical protein